jgi:transglutaminase-like putative cysteine protease
MGHTMHTASIDLQLDYEVAQPAHFLFNIEAAFADGHRVVSERLSITPAVKVRTFFDERNGNRFVRLDAPRGQLSVNYNAKVELVSWPVPLHLNEALVTDVPDEVLRYLMPSRYCESDLLSRVAQQMFGHLPHGLSRVRAIENWIHASINYIPGFSNATTTAQEVFVQRAGVCRDFAHLGITLCRALNIAARLVRVGTGRDAKDVAFATIFGNVQMLRKELKVNEGDQLTNQPGKAAAPLLSVVML